MIIYTDVGVFQRRTYRPYRYVVLVKWDGKWQSVRWSARLHNARGAARRLGAGARVYEIKSGRQIMPDEPSPVVSVERKAEQ